MRSVLLFIIATSLLVVARWVAPEMPFGQWIGVIVLVGSSQLAAFFALEDWRD